MVAAGLRGQLQTGSLVTGQLYVELGFHPDAPVAAVIMQDGVQVVPTVPASVEALASKVGSLLDTLATLLLREIAGNILETSEGANRLVNSEALSGSITELECLLAQTNSALKKIDTKVVPEAAAALSQARQTLSTARQLLARDSTLVGESIRTLRGVTAAARSINGLAEYLERHPEALINGKGRR